MKTDTCTNEVGGYVLDDRYELFAYTTEKDVYDSSGIGESLSQLPQYPYGDSENYIWNMYKNSMFMWDITCE